MDYSFLTKEKTPTSDYSFLTVGKKPLAKKEEKKKEEEKEYTGLTASKIIGGAKKLISTISGAKKKVQETKTGIVKSVAEPVKNIVKDKAQELKEKATVMGFLGQEKAQKLRSYQKSPEGKLEKALKTEKKLETQAKILTAPIRFTAGSLATAATSYALEKADSNLKYTPKTDAEKLLIGDNDIQRLTKQEDLYGTVARGAGVPAALGLIAVLENPFIKDIGVGTLIKEGIERQISKQGTKALANIGSEQIIKLTNDIIKAEKTAGKIDPVQADKVINQISGLRVVETPKETAKEAEPLVEEAKKYKTADEFIKAQSLYHGTPAKLEGGKLSFGKGNVKRGGQSGGLFLTDNPNSAKTFAFGGEIYQATPEIKNQVIDLTKKDGIDKFKSFIGKSYKDFDGELIKFDKYSFDSMFPNGKADFATVSQFPELVEKIVKDNKLRGIAFNEFAGGEVGKTYQILSGDIPVYNKSQLTDIWNKSQEIPEVKYEPSIPNRIKNETIAKGIKTDFGDIASYEKVSFEDQAKKVGEIIDQDPEKAIRIALGEELPTNGALPESVLIAVKNQAIKKGDTELLIKLATSEKGVARESTELGQRIKMLDERLETDAFKNISDVVKNREKYLKEKGVNVSKAKSEEIKKIKSELDKAKPKVDEWKDFIKSITC